MGSSPTPNKPLGVISPDDQSGLISIMTALSLSFILVSFAIRIYVRHPKGLWKLDDNILTAATILSCVQAALVFYEVSIGLGKTSVIFNNEGDFTLLRKFQFANNYLYLLSLLFSKGSIGFLYLRLTRARRHVVATWIIQACCAAWAVLSIILISVGVPWENAFVVPFWRWLVVGVTDCITDTLLVLMSFYLVKDLRMSVVQKGTVVFAFALRLLTIPAIAMRVYYLHPSSLTSNRTLAISLSIVCTQLELGYGIMAASVTVLKPFMAVYEKNPDATAYGTPGAANKYYGGNTGKGSYKLDSMASAASQKITSLTSPGSTLINSDASASKGHGLRSPTQSYSAVVSHWDGGQKKKNSQRERAASIQSQDSTKMIIERKTDWSIRYEEEGAKDGVSDRCYSR